MNAVVGLCHFCESHGPRIVFLTQVFKENKIMTRENPIETECPACTSIGVKKSFITKEKDGIIYCSSQVASSESVEVLLKQACVRSLSCEVSTSKENALVFFGNTGQGYVLSYTFQLKDTQARGLKRLFSIIVLMKDKMYLLNLLPHFSNEIQVTAKELETLSDEVYAKEQASCPQRALRLRRGKMDSQPPRSLDQLTGKISVFGFLHMRSSCMLSAASKIYTEISCNQLLPKNANQNMTQNGSEDETQFTLRQLEQYLTNDHFLKVLYCTLIGIQIVVRGDSDKCGAIISLLESLLPKTAESLEFSDYVSPTESRLFSCKSNVAVPQPCSGVCRIDIVNEAPLLHWSGNLPFKWPTFMTNIVKAMNECSFSESTLKQQVFALQDEWKNNAMALKLIQNSSPTIISTMKRSLGIKPQDETLLEYWMSNFIK